MERQSWKHNVPRFLGVESGVLTREFASAGAPDAIATAFLAAYGGLFQIVDIGAFRDMMDPTRFQHPDRTNSSFYYCGSGDSGGVHINSGVANKAFALMVDGVVFNTYTI